MAQYASGYANGNPLERKIPMHIRRYGYMYEQLYKE